MHTIQSFKIMVGKSLAGFIRIFCDYLSAATATATAGIYNIHRTRIEDRLPFISNARLPVCVSIHPRRAHAHAHAHPTHDHRPPKRLPKVPFHPIVLPVK
jgi:hypothetical protein